VSAQCFEADGVTVRPSYFNIWVAVDQTWIDFYGGDEALARMVAKQGADDAIAVLNESAFNTTFLMTFFRGFAPSKVAPAFLLDKTNWCLDVRNFYWAQYPCVDRPDLILLFTKEGEIGQAHGFGFDKVAIVGGASSLVIAHELGHTIGLMHLPQAGGSPNCCALNPTMMCIPLPTNPKITPLNTSCGATFNWLNLNVFTQSFCSTIRSFPSFYPDDDFECPPPTFSGFKVFSENPHPVVGCKTDGDITTYTLTFTNNNSNTARNFRVIIPDSYADFVEFIEDPSLDFTCIKDVPNSRKEFWITEPGCSDEKNFAMAPGETKVLKFKVRYLGGFQAVGGILLKAYTGIFSAQNYDIDFTLSPTFLIPGGNFSTIHDNFNWKINSPLLISGNLVMNMSQSTWVGNTYNFAANGTLYFAAGAGLEVAAGNTVKMPHVQIEGCSTMWKGITVREGATLEMNMMTSVSDAQFAVNVQKGGTAVVESCKFTNNNFGIRTAPEGAGVHQITALGNRFATTGAGLKPSWGGGQQPAPGEKGFTGIYANNLTGGLLVDKDPDFGITNEFSDLHYGILAENTHVTVRDAIFTDILQETRPTSYPGPLTTGNAIYVSGGNADIKGNFTGIVPGPLKMDNCHVGVNTRGGSIAVEGCEMSNMTNGVVALGGINKSYAVNWNNINASDRGISVFYQSGIPGASSVSNNIIRMAGNANGAGIAIGGQEMFPQNEGFVAGNSVTVEEGATGIQIGVANKLKVTQNNVSLAGSSARFGIRMEGGDQNTLNCNIITNPGGGNNDGIYAIHASRAGVLCNTADGPARGLRFEGMLAGRNKADIAGNMMESNTAAGLVLGTDAVVGPQAHRGNKFEGTGAVAGAGADDHSKFAVDANENADFLPFPVFPSGWFENIADPAPSYQCVPGTTCPLPAIASDYPLDIKIVKGELGGATYQAANQWLAQRRFYERVLEEGNPYPGNPFVAAFLSQAQSNGFAGYSNLQVGIRLLGGMSEGNRAVAAAGLLSLNDNLTGSATWQVNEKAVNQIFLQTAAIGNNELTESQITTLESIAEGCPLSDGEAVLRARAMLNLLEGSPVVYDDFVICGSGERSEENRRDAKSSLRVYPNPANDFLNIDYSSVTNTDSQLLIFNAQGQSVREIMLVSKAGVIQVSLNSIPSGVYWYVAPGIGVGKFIVQH
jgi:hypothetical protein